LYVPGVQEKLDKSEIDEIVVTDTIQVDSRFQILDSRKSKLKILSVAQMVADEII
jgi:phosphoribosylpyrophosphate synthetase